MPKGPSKDARITARFTESEKLRLSEEARQIGITISELVRRKSLGSRNIRARVKRSEEEIVTLRSLIGMANNLNQLTKLAHSGILQENEILDTLKKVDRLIDQL